ncbi:Sodium/hydrogen exchanger [Spironucleus salmonicida]|uniref:Sodium/hydrogen exchanger n=1 Tax=Spironucleus salmonicida TaxID=348837 RepID=V6LLB7_9EUKA|nr:Sodium/hydrogen exchanger [Spironucleus salmonicida]|eukprot:EST44531.1 Sodium/hydrogen exchanger [Spironucleus salmonicida]
MSDFALIGFHLNPITGLLLGMLVLFGILSILRLVYAKSKPEQYLPESTMLIIIGLLIGLIIGYIPTDGANTLKELLTFDPDYFLFIFIPVIIFDAAYFMDKQVFFNNFLEIIVYAVFGTIFNSAFIGIAIYYSLPIMNTPMSFADVFTFSSLCSAVDPVSVMAIMEQMHVNADLYNLGFGESTLNDGVSIVLFSLFKGMSSLFNDNKTISEIIGLGIAKFIVSVSGGLLIATIITFLFCFFTKYTYKLYNIEPILLIICGFFSYILADALLFSGIMAVMISAVILSRYAEPNLHPESINTFRTVIHMLAQTFENMLFLDMGFQIAFISVVKNGIDWALVGLLIIYTFLARFIGVFGQTALLNLRRKKFGKYIPFNEQIILVWAGLRGAIAFALASSISTGVISVNEELLFATCMLIIFTILVYGLSMKPLIYVLKIKKQHHDPELHDLSYYQAQQKMAQTALARPIEEQVKFVKTLLGQSSKMAQFAHKADMLLQKVFLKQNIKVERDIIRIIEHVKRMDAQGRLKIEENVAQKRYVQTVGIAARETDIKAQQRAYEIQRRIEMARKGEGLLQ